MVCIACQRCGVVWKCGEGGHHQFGPMGL